MSVLMNLTIPFFSMSSDRVKRQINKVTAITCYFKITMECEMKSCQRKGTTKFLFHMNLD